MLQRVERLAGGTELPGAAVDEDEIGEFGGVLN